MTSDAERRIAALEARLTALEGASAARKTMARYMALCDVPSGALDGESLARLFTADAVWEGIGPQYTSKFGRIEGREAIVAMLARYLPPDPHFATNVHFLTSESIDMVSPGRAKGRWIMLQASGYEGDRAELIGARLEVDFVSAPDASAWLIAHFRTERLFDAPWRVSPRPAS
ncbi:nuclear transport factor 2 family protein [Paraburkholderia unamae]|uniref:nuclear transport factor 2 family protein n=1 Tax=Paraburkholderia unamae TaxID=219649 RepID=UPI001CC568CB|nr:nuclear transport factor 2 family protein [Paraburkholderia unamae]